MVLFVVDDHSRVVLHDCGPEHDYINASYISVIFCSLIWYSFKIFRQFLFIFMLLLLWTWIRLHQCIFWRLFVLFIFHWFS